MAYILKKRRKDKGMLKKIIAASAISMVACGVSFAKTGALDIMEWVLQDAEKAGITYNCVGDNSHATCHFKNIDGFLFQLKDVRTDMWLNDNEVRQEISGSIVANLEEDLNKFVPKSFTCNSTSTLEDLQNSGNGTCVIKSDVATLSLDSKTLLESRSFRYKTMPTLLVQYITKINQFSKEYDHIQTKYQNDLEALRKESASALDDINTEIEMLESSQNQQQYGCGCMGNPTNEAIAQNKETKERITESYTKKYDEIQKRYEEEMQNFNSSIVAWLSQYNYTIQEVRIHVRSDGLAESVTNLAKKYLTLNSGISFLKNKQTKNADIEKRITAQYYSALEASRAAGMTFVGYSPYLAPHLRTSLQKIISDQAKLLDPNANKNSIKILITPLKNNATMNLGNEAQKFINAYSKGRNHALIQSFFDIINQYDIKSVRMWPENN